MRSVTRLACCIVATLVGLVFLSGCDEDTVRLTFRPTVGMTSTYRITVETDTTIQIGNEAPREGHDKVVLVTQHTILGPQPLGPDAKAKEKSDENVRVKVVVKESEKADRTFIVRFDRSGHPVAVESESPTNPDASGTTSLGLPEIFPAAMGAPPNRLLRSGDTWDLRRSITLPGSAHPADINIKGRLVELGVVDTKDVARVSSTATLNLQTTRSAANGLLPAGKVQLDGTQTTYYEATHFLDNGSVRSAASTTIGDYQLLISPPKPVGGNPASGTMKVRIESETERID